MKPSVGRIVHYYKEHPTDEGCEGEPKAAIITKVHSDLGGDCVDLKVFSYNGLGEERFFTFVLWSHVPTANCWIWPARV